MCKVIIVQAQKYGGICIWNRFRLIVIGPKVILHYRDTQVMSRFNYRFTIISLITVREN
jgi:hypothetical protein